MYSSYLAQQTVGNGYLQQANDAMVAGNIAIGGFNLQSQSYRNSATAVQQATNFNLGVDTINLTRSLADNNRKAQRTLSQQVSQTAASGLGLTGKSYLALRNDAINTFAQQSLNLRQDYENSNRAKIYESQVTQMNLENQARATDYQAATTRYNTNKQVAAYQSQANTAYMSANRSLLKAITGT